MHVELLAMLQRIAGDKLNERERFAIVDNAVRIFEDHNKSVANAVLDSATPVLQEKKNGR